MRRSLCEEVKRGAGGSYKTQRKPGKNMFANRNIETQQKKNKERRTTDDDQDAVRRVHEVYDLSLLALKIPFSPFFFYFYNFKSAASCEEIVGANWCNMHKREKGTRGE